MPRLVDYFLADRAQLHQQLQRARNSIDVMHIIQSELLKLCDVKGPYIGGLTVPQARVAVPLIDAFRLSFSALTSIESETANSDSAEGMPVMLGPVVTGIPLNYELVGGVISAATIGSLVGGIVGTVLGTVGGLTVAVGVSKLQGNNNERNQDVAVIDHNRSGVTVDAARILDYLQQTCTVIDHIVGEYGSMTEPAPLPQPSLESHPEILEFLQGLLSDTAYPDTSLPDPVRMRLRQLPTVLRLSGIQVQQYHSDNDSQNQHSFDLEPSEDRNLDQPVTMAPAFVKDGRVILRGRAIVPQQLD
ncbi:MAG: hypothetical protein OHK0022_36910 [Roseiflexaceae bacterium]